MTPSGRGTALVIGAGPVGLSCALALHARGVAVTVLEAEREDGLRPGSRAIYLHGASLALLERAHAGLGRGIAAHGLVWPAKRTFWRGREVFARTYPPAPTDRLPPFISLPQTVIERELAAACATVGIDLVRGARAQALAVGSGAV
ncbi:MAG: FAD-dependent monooxygenase, partial [Actinomycetota bacterium]|nr:FAD-dependent monooxygenase [Actinomycetota bacterium]